MTYTLSQANDRVQTGETDAIWYPRQIRGATKYGALFFHGGSTASNATSNSAWPDVWRMCAALANAGIPVIAPSDGVDAFANDTAMSRITASITALANATGCSSSKIHLLGQSMGGGTAARYAALNPTKVASVNAVIPMASIISLYRNNHPTPGNYGFSASIGAQWSRTSRTPTLTTTSGSLTVTGPASTFTSADVGAGVIHANIPLGAYIATYNSATSVTLAAGYAATASGSAASTIWPALPTSGSPNADIISLAAAIKTNNIPGRLFYSSADQYIQTSDVTALATAAGWSAVSIDSSAGHADGTVASWRAYNAGSEFSDLVAYLIANGA